MIAAQNILIQTLGKRITEATQQACDRDGGVATLDIAAWLRLPGLARQQVSLLLRYRDAAGEREVIVDEGRVDDTHQILLSSIAQVPVHEKLDQLHVRLCSANAPRGMVVETLHVKPL